MIRYVYTRTGDHAVQKRNYAHVCVCIYSACVSACTYMYTYLYVVLFVIQPYIQIIYILYTYYIHIIYILYTCIYMYVLGALLWIWTPGLQDSPELELEMEGSLLLSVLDTACLGLSRLAGTSEALVNLRKSPRSFRIPSTKLQTNHENLLLPESFAQVTLKTIGSIDLQ